MHLKINLACPNERLISIEKENFFFESSIQPHVFFSTGLLTSTENLKSYIPWFIFKPSKCNFRFSHPQKITHSKLQDKRMTKTIVTTEKVNSK